MIFMSNYLFNYPELADEILLRLNSMDIYRVTEVDSGEDLETDAKKLTTYKELGELGLIDYNPNNKSYLEIDTCGYYCLNCGGVTNLGRMFIDNTNTSDKYTVFLNKLRETIVKTGVSEITKSVISYVISQLYMH